MLGLTNKSEATLIAYEPGNGSRYLMELTLTVATGRAVFTWWRRQGENGGTSFVVQLDEGVDVGHYIHWSYLAEKMDTGQADAEQIAAIINNVLPTFQVRYAASRLAERVEQWNSEQ